jgi:hypothetical protein
MSSLRPSLARLGRLRCGMVREFESRRAATGGDFRVDFLLEGLGLSGERWGCVRV